MTSETLKTGIDGEKKAESVNGQNRVHEFNNSQRLALVREQSLIQSRIDAEAMRLKSNQAGNVQNAPGENRAKKKRENGRSPRR